MEAGTYRKARVKMQRMVTFLMVGAAAWVKEATVQDPWEVGGCPIGGSCSGEWQAEEGRQRPFLRFHPLI